ncbi:hypothetical protein [Propionivibrio sp.]|uniref:hypothetical protein n=1 Tax=Propionivibrio sp. TaxID=2212460 RepID=UPI0026190D7D|nr:hypothetical protein [Propionivibrio sp.]
MQALLSFDQSPPLDAPFRFFLTAPLFAILAGFFLLWSGPELFASRWTPAALALTHLIAAGFMLQAMLGALVQIMPVVAGANMGRPMRVARIVHAAITLGALLLVAAFLSFLPLLFKLSVVFLGAGLAIFVGCAAQALSGLASTSPTIQGLKYALVGLSVTVVLGVLLAGSLGWSLDFPLMQLSNIHLSWGFVAWGTVLLAAVGHVVVPMFQLTPAYPDWFSRRFSFSTLAVAALWTLAELCTWEVPSDLLGTALVAHAALFAGVTLHIQRRSKRARFDATQYYWRGAMISALAASAVWLLARTVTNVGEWPAWPLLCGILVLFGGFMSVIIGMLYKIVPFLLWLHLQNQGRGRMPAPNMKKIISERDMDHQMLAHLGSCTLLLLAVFWPAVFVYPAGIALMVANGWLMRNLLSALSVHRNHLLKIEQMIGNPAQ